MIAMCFLRLLLQLQSRRNLILGGLVAGAVASSLIATTMKGDPPKLPSRASMLLLLLLLMGTAASCSSHLMRPPLHDVLMRLGFASWLVPADASVRGEAYGTKWYREAGHLVVVDRDGDSFIAYNDPKEEGSLYLQVRRTGPAFTTLTLRRNQPHCCVLGSSSASLAPSRVAFEVITAAD